METENLLISADRLPASQEFHTGLVTGEEKGKVHPCTGTEALYKAKRLIGGVEV
jgi:hypothetical protein